MIFCVRFIGSSNVVPFLEFNGLDRLDMLFVVDINILSTKPSSDFCACRGSKPLTVVIDIVEADLSRWSKERGFLVDRAVTSITDFREVTVMSEDTGFEGVDETNVDVVANESGESGA
jgi:hypothetical protein